MKLRVDWETQGDCFTCRKLRECFPGALIAREGLHPIEFMDAVCEEWEPEDWATLHKGTPASRHIDRGALQVLVAEGGGHELPKGVKE